jgi:hypothetical protein
MSWDGGTPFVDSVNLPPFVERDLMPSPGSGRGQFGFGTLQALTMPKALSPCDKTRTSSE